MLPSGSTAKKHHWPGDAFSTDMPDSETHQETDLSVMATEINAIVARARAAQAIYDAYDQVAVDEVVTAAGWAVVQPDNNRQLSELAVADTGLGKVADKFLKNCRKTIGLLRDLRAAKSVGVIAEYPEKGIIEIARPIGVVGAIVPSTNPVATPINKIINALKGRNAIILAPSPKGDRTCARLLELIHAELERIGAPTDLVQKLPAPVSKAATQHLMRRVDLIVATGSQNNVRGAYMSGTPAVGVGAGNVISIIDETANVVQAAQKIVISKSFDNATSCSSENNLIVVDVQYDAAVSALLEEGAVLLDQANQTRLQQALWQQGRLNQDLIAREATEIVALAKLTVETDESTRILLVEENSTGPQHPGILSVWAGEKLCPVLTLYRTSDFESAKQLARDILDYQGKGHSLSLHSADPARALDLGLNMPVCRVIVNQIHCYATGGSFDNGLPFSLSMGCGSWGKNSISDNLNYRHYLNTTRIAYRIEANQPTEQDIFGKYWERYGIKSGTKG